MDTCGTLVPLFSKDPRSWYLSRTTGLGTVCRVYRPQVTKLSTCIQDSSVNETRSLPRRTLLGKMIFLITSLGKVHLGFNGRSIHTGKVHVVSLNQGVLFKLLSQSYVQVDHSLIDKTFHYITGKSSPVHNDADLPGVRLSDFFAQVNLCREDECFFCITGKGSPGPRLMYD